MAGEVATERLKITGAAHAEPGSQPVPPIIDFPLLVWSPLQWGEDVYTEDGKASVAQIVQAMLKLLDFDAVAARFGTTTDHVEQALDYALRARDLEAGA